MSSAGHCSVCEHPQVAGYNAAIVAGESLRYTALRFDGPSSQSIFRHKKHSQDLLLAGIEARNAVLRESLLKSLDDVLVQELAKSQVHRDMLKDSFAKKGYVTKAEWNEAIDGMFGAQVRVISYIRRLLKDGANAGSPNSREGLMTGISGVGPRLRRVKPPKAETEIQPKPTL
jgi:hypothetical protein